MESKDQLIQMLDSFKDQQQFQDALLATAHAHEISRDNLSKFLNRRSKAKKKKQSKIKHHLI